MLLLCEWLMPATSQVFPAQTPLGRAISLQTIVYLSETTTPYTEKVFLYEMGQIISL